MCDKNIIHDLGNGKGSDPATHGLALRECMIDLKSIKATLSQMPTRSEMESAFRLHTNSCAEARHKAEEPEQDNRLKLAIGKFLGFEAEGKMGTIISAVFWGIIGIVVYIVATHAGELGSLLQK